MEEKDWCDGLSLRAQNGLRMSAGFTSREEVLAAYHRGEINNIRNVGKRTVHEICNWLGVSAPDPPKQIRHRFSIGEWSITVMRTRNWG